jgi:hypothetical protein
MNMANILSRLNWINSLTIKLPIRVTVFPIVPANPPALERTAAGV